MKEGVLLKRHPGQCARVNLIYVAPKTFNGLPPGIPGNFPSIIFGSSNRLYVTDRLREEHPM